MSEPRSIEPSLRDALLIALANNPLCDDLEDDESDATHLYDAGLLRLSRDLSDEYYTTITDAGQEFILESLRASSSLPSPEGQEKYEYECANRHRWATNPDQSEHRMKCPHCGTITLSRRPPK